MLASLLRLFMEDVRILECALLVAGRLLDRVLAEYLFSTDFGFSKF
jgi:hypothetical protein